MPNEPATDAPVALVNVFEIPAEHVDTFIADWQIRADFTSRQPGFRDYRLHRAVLPDSWRGPFARVRPQCGGAAVPR